MMITTTRKSKYQYTIQIGVGKSNMGNARTNRGGVTEARTTTMPNLVHENLVCITKAKMHDEIWHGDHGHETRDLKQGVKQIGWRSHLQGRVDKEDSGHLFLASLRRSLLWSLRSTRSEWEQ